ncbi:MAG: hypothetical protein KBT04_00515, partial [Bacteroidales bacterium]|nr:hypothetical protein [Candidatus Colimorpha onthohippi]
GLFSVAPGKKVRFSQGNLQYTTVGSHACADGTTKAGTWRFADHQYDYMGNGNDSISSNYTGWIDLFGWGTSGYNECYPYLTTTDGSIYGPSGAYNLTGDSANYDWGVYNAISNGGNVAGKWRTLTKDEWEYLFRIRNNATSKYGIAKITLLEGTYAVMYDIRGLVCLPDEWKTPLDCNFTPGLSAKNEYTSSQWAAMEKAGAVFLPLAGSRGNTNFLESVAGEYWSSTAYSSYAYYMTWAPIDISVKTTGRNSGLSVRLVCE